MRLMFDCAKHKAHRRVVYLHMGSSSHVLNVQGCTQVNHALWGRELTCQCWVQSPHDVGTLLWHATMSQVGLLQSSRRHGGLPAAGHGACAGGKPNDAVDDAQRLQHGAHHAAPPLDHAAGARSCQAPEGSSTVFV